MTLQDLIAELERLDAAATPGPWKAMSGAAPLDDTGDYLPYWIVDGPPSKNPQVCRLDYCRDEGDECDANMDFIAFSGTHRGAILAHLKRLAELEGP